MENLPRVLQSAKALEGSTGNVIVMMTIDTIGGLAPYEFGTETMRAWKKCWLRIGCSVSLMIVDFPLPLTPVTQTNTPNGMSNVTSLRLLPVAPSMMMCLLSLVERRLGMSMLRMWAR